MTLAQRGFIVKHSLGDLSIFGLVEPLEMQ